MKLHKALAEALNPLMIQIDMTSAWVCEVEGEVTTVVGQWISEHANMLEKDGDLQATHIESKYSSLGEWLRSETRPPRLLQVDTLPRNDAEYRELSTNGVKSVMNVAIPVDGKFWGYLELWETRQPRLFSADEVALVEATIPTLARVIMESEGEMPS